jgi:HAD superfamily hydrolase (TIGR01509 family)
MTLTEPNAILFDMDGTLIDSEGLWLEAEILVMSELGADWTDDDQSYCLGGPLERVVDYMLMRSGSEEPASFVMDRLLDTMEAHFRDRPLAWRPGARTLVTEARTRGVPTALVSASWNRLIDAISQKIDADLGVQAFDVVVAGDDVTNSKPHPEPYQTAADLLGVPTAQCLALEDSPTGVASATAAGCRVVAIPHIAEIDAMGAYVIDSLEGWTVEALWAAAAS